MTTTVTIIHNMHRTTHNGTQAIRHNHPTETVTFPEDFSNPDYAGRTIPDGCGPFENVCENCVLRVVGSYETGAVNLDEIYEANGNNYGGEKVFPNARTLSVGDVIVWGDAAHKVASFGFEEVDAAVVAKGLGNQAATGEEIL